MNSLYPDTFKDIVRFSLRPIGKWSVEAENILFMIAAHESLLGKELKQINGPALGLYGMEPDTLFDLYKTYLVRKPGYVKDIVRMTGVTEPSLEHLQFNPVYSTVIARIKLLRDSAPLPTDVPTMAVYAKRVWNGTGKATPEKYISAYFSFL